MICWGCRDLDVMLLLLLLLPPSLVESSVLAVVGGSESILLESQRESLVLTAAEIVGCHNRDQLPLPDYPRQDAQIRKREVNLEWLFMVFRWGFSKIRISFVSSVSDTRVAIITTT